MSKYTKIPLRHVNLEKQLLAVKEWSIPASEKNYIEKFASELRIGKVTGGQNSEGSVSSYITNLRLALQFINKPTKEIKSKDVEKLCDALLKDLYCKTIRKKDDAGKTLTVKEPYTETGKIKIKTILRMYLEWRLKDKAEKLSKILDVRHRRKSPTPDYLSESDIEKLYKGCKSAEERYLISMLFDTGARAEEFHNIRYEDIELPKDSKSNFVKITLKEEYSKTKGRTVGLYWTHSTEAVQDYLKQRIAEGIEPNDPVFKNGYRGTRKFLERLGKKILGRSIYYHLFRHSSATNYANKMNRQDLCIRYGWTFRSPMPDRYIDRAGVESKKVDDGFQQTNFQELNKKIEFYAKRDKIKSSKMTDMERKIEMLVTKLESMSKAIANN